MRAEEGWRKQMMSVHDGGQVKETDDNPTARGTSAPQEPLIGQVMGGMVVLFFCLNCPPLHVTLQRGGRGGAV